MLVYLAAPIDGVDENNRTLLVDTVCEALHKINVAVFRPVYAFAQTSITAMTNNADKIRAINRAAITNCNALIAILSGPGRALGTIREIEFARSVKKPVFVVGSFVSLEAFDVCMVHPDLMGRPESWQKLLLDQWVDQEGLVYPSE